MISQLSSASPAVYSPQSHQDELQKSLSRIMSYLFKTTQNQIQIPCCWGFESNNAASSLSPAPAQNQLGSEPRTEADGYPGTVFTDEKAVEDHGLSPLNGRASDVPAPVVTPLSEAAPVQSLLLLGMAPSVPSPLSHFRRQPSHLCSYHSLLFQDCLFPHRFLSGS